MATVTSLLGSQEEQHEFYGHEFTSRQDSREGLY